MRKYLLVEGKSDLAFVEYICEISGIVLGENMSIVDMQGKGGLARTLASLEPELARGESIAVILDADKSFGSSKKETEKIISDRSVDFFLAPNHSDPGNLETLLLSTVDENDVILCFDEYIECLEEKGFNTYTVDNKAKLYAYTKLTFDKTPEKSFDSNERHWDLGHPKFSAINEFVISFFK